MRRKIRIVIWNCAQAFHKKYHYLIEQLAPDIAIVPECARPNILMAKKVPLQPNTYSWLGEKPQKGLGIFAFNDYTLTLGEALTPTLKWILPVKIEGPVELNLIGIWARYTEAKKMRAPGPVLDFLDSYRDLLNAPNTIVAGDFNSNVRFTRGLRRHGRIVAGLNDCGLASAYHHFHKVEQGEEPHPTIYWRDRKMDGPSYHIDYCFVPKDWTPFISGVSIGRFEKWVQTVGGDHVPLTIDIEFP